MGEKTPRLVVRNFHSRSIASVAIKTHVRFIGNHCAGLPLIFLFLLFFLSVIFSARLKHFILLLFPLKKFRYFRASNARGRHPQSSGLEKISEVKCWVLSENFAREEKETEKARNSIFRRRIFLAERLLCFGT